VLVGFISKISHYLCYTSDRLAGCVTLAYCGRIVCCKVSRAEVCMVMGTTGICGNHGKSVVMGITFTVILCGWGQGTWGYCGNGDWGAMLMILPQ